MTVPRSTAARVAPVLAAVAPSVMAAVRALHARWLPIGDNGYFAVRARDVLTADHPLLGAWSSGSQAVGVDVNNLGPLQLDLLYPFVRALGLGPGTIVAVTLLNAASAALVVVLAHRRAGRLGAWMAAAVTVGLSWSLGSELLVEPRQHHALVLPFLACLALAWSLADGDVRVLPVAAFVGTFVAQTHLTFLIPLGAVAVVALVSLALRLRRTGPDPPPDIPPVRRILAITAVVLAVCWSQTVIEQLQPEGGNLSSIVEAASVDTPTYGAAAGARAVATVVVPGVGWLPPTFSDFDPNETPIGAGAAASILGLLGVSLLGLAVAARHRGDRTVLAGLWVTGAALAAAVYAAASSPSGRFGVLASNFRWLWPIAAFTACVLALALVRLRPAWERSPRLVGAIAAGTVALAVWALPASHQGPGAADSAALIDVSRSFLDQIHDFDFDGTVLIDRRGTYFGEPFSYVMFAGLQDQGIPWESALPQDARRFGERRAYDGTADGTLTMVTGALAEEPRPGSERIAFASWLTDAQRAELAELRAASEAGPLSDEDDERFLELRHRRAGGTVALWFTPGPPAPL